MTLSGLKQFFLRNGRYLFLIVFILSVYSQLIGKKTFSPDAQMILKPLLDIESPLKYFEMLASFEVIDFQPVRDFTFFIDIFFFRFFKINTFAFTNIILWCGSCILLMSLSRKNPILIYAFAAYPIFSQAISWTMARKHVLALFLILWATKFFLESLEGKRSWLFPYLAYVAAALSQPIVLFWPCWALLYFTLMPSDKKNYEWKKIFGIFFTTMVVLLLTNYAYYTVLNDHAREFYGQAKPAFSVVNVLINLGFYFRQIVWPYELSFVYYPNFPKALVGFIVLLTLAVIGWRFRKNREAICWLAFAFLPFPVVIGLTYYDQYLLLIGTGLIMCMSFLITGLNRYFTGILIASIIFWAYFTYQQTGLWTHTARISERNFRNAPTCRSAIEFANISAAVEEMPSMVVINYIAKEKCFAVPGKLPPMERPKIFVVRSLYLLLVDDGLSEEDRMKELSLLSTYHYYPGLIYAIALLKLEKDEEIKELTEFIHERTKGQDLLIGPYVQNILRPYCQKHKLAACLEVIAKKETTELPYL